MSKQCQSIEHPNLMSGGWGCCMCKTYNGTQRTECKFCNHKRCDLDIKNKAN